MNLIGNEQKKGGLQVAFLVFTLACVAVLARPNRLNGFHRTGLGAEKQEFINYQRLHYTAKIHFCESKVELLNSTER